MIKKQLNSTLTHYSDVPKIDSWKRKQAPAVLHLSP